MKRIIILLAAMCLLAFGSIALAGNKPETKTFEGTLNCLGCDLKKADGANAQCKAYGHGHSLRMKDGSYISFLENDNSAELLKGGDWHGKQVKVTGTYFAKANTLDVKSFEIGGKEYSYCAGHKKNDQCHAGHDHSKH